MALASSNWTYQKESASQQSKNYLIASPVLFFWTTQKIPLCRHIRERQALKVNQRSYVEMKMSSKLDPSRSCCCWQICKFQVGSWSTLANSNTSTHKRNGNTMQKLWMRKRLIQKEKNTNRTDSLLTAGQHSQIKAHIKGVQIQI